MRFEATPLTLRIIRLSNHTKYYISNNNNNNNNNDNYNYCNRVQSDITCLSSLTPDIKFPLLLRRRPGTDNENDPIVCLRSLGQGRSLRKITHVHTYIHTYIQTDIHTLGTHYKTRQFQPPPPSKPLPHRSMYVTMANFTTSPHLTSPHLISPHPISAHLISPPDLASRRRRRRRHHRVILGRSAYGT
jgi:hypothetical protein